MNHMLLRCLVCGYEGNEIEVDDHMISKHAQVIKDGDREICPDCENSFGLKQMFCSKCKGKGYVPIQTSA